MMKVSRASAAFADSKPHYLALDGLRGVAALVVVWYHIFEAFATSPIDQVFNHGYLAVDFFFLLSGFVVAYAYGDRWGRMTVGEFFKRRLIRLHPMVVLGAVLGALMFYTQVTPTQPLNLVPLSALIVATLANMLMLPAMPAMDIRGYTEIFPLNGPAWSLFFEYIANIVYALVLRPLSNRWLMLVVGVLALLFGYEILVHSPWKYIGAGWSFADGGFWGGLIRVGVSFSVGLLMSRYFKPIKFRWGFELGAILLIVLLSMPRIGGEEAMWLNGIYELICCMLIFPLIVFLGAANSSIASGRSRLMRFLGDLSYPLYIIHYPFIYLYIAWVKTEELTFVASLPGALALFFGSILLAYVSNRVYDLPVRRWLEKRFL